MGELAEGMSVAVSVGDIWQLTDDRWQVTYDTLYETYDMQLFLVSVLLSAHIEGAQLSS